MISLSFGAMGVMIMTLAVVTIPVAIVWIVGKLLVLTFTLVGSVLGLAGGIVGRALGFARAEVVDALHLVGGILTGLVIAPLALANLAIGRLRSAGHYGRALEDECTSSAISLYRIALGHPARFLGLGALTHGLEQRLPDLVSRAPRPAPRSARAAAVAFEGYKITGTLAAGGSGARLFLARPRESTVRRYLAAGHPDPGQVVIKSFALEHGSTLPQIVRESRALEAAKRLGLVLEHNLDEDSFWYAMPFVPGDDLDVVVRRLHARADSSGLGAQGLRKVVGFSSDILATLQRFHHGGLWHKDIKPSNLIVSGDRVHLVDLGLVTPLASAMTLTTHGTEFFRDPELVRLAMRGVKVHEVDGVKFDIYSAGAVLYSMIENSFPAHGSLSRIAKNCPDALAWIVRRSMADVDQRYASAEEMARDLDVLMAADDLFAVRPADLPSMGGAPVAATASWRRSESPARPFPLEDLAPAAAPVFDGPPSVETPVPDTDMRVRRRSRRGVMVAACLAFLCGALVVNRMRSGIQHFSPQVVHSSWWPAGTEDWLRDWTESDSGPSAGAERFSVRTPRVRALSQRRATLDQPTLRLTGPKPRVMSSEPVGTILLLTDLGVDSSSKEVRGLREALLDRGLKLLGYGADGGGPETIDLIAGARRAVELDSLDDRDAARRLQAYLDSRSSLDAIIWLGPGSKEGSVSYRMFERDPAAARALTAGRDAD